MLAVAKLTAKGQTTIPLTVRKRLKLRAGDRIIFALDGDRVVLRRAEALDAAYLKLASQAMADWASPEAEEAFRDF